LLCVACRLVENVAELLNRRDASLVLDQILLVIAVKTQRGIPTLTWVTSNILQARALFTLDVVKGSLRANMRVSKKTFGVL
jgi:hypothetical protein